MSVEHRFKKNLVAFPTNSNTTTFTLTAPNLITPADEPNLAVYFNGQLLQQYTSGDLTQFAKYYYTFNNDNSYYLANPAEVGAENHCTAVITVVANQDFTNGFPYASGEIPYCNFETTDVFYISFYYTVVGAL